MRDLLVCRKVLVGFALLLPLVSTGVSASNAVSCLVSEVKTAYADAQKGITKTVQEDIEKNAPAADQDFTAIGCIDSFGISGGYSLPDVSLPSTDELCEAASDYVDDQLNALNSVVNSYEMPAGMSAGLDLSADGDDEFNNKYLKKLEEYRDKVQDSADKITKDREGSASYTPEMPGGASR